MSRKAAQFITDPLSHPSFQTKYLLQQVISNVGSFRSAQYYVKQYEPLVTPVANALPGSKFPPKKHYYDPKGSLRGVNLGNLYLPSPEPVRHVETIHAAVVKITDVSNLDDEVLNGITLTLQHLLQLGVRSVIVVGSANEKDYTAKQARVDADRVVASIERLPRARARHIDKPFGVRDNIDQATSSVPVRDNVYAYFPAMVTAPLRIEITPVITPFGFIDSSQKVINIGSDKAVLALVREFAGLNGTFHVEQPITSSDSQGSGMIVDAHPKDSHHIAPQILVDRLIILDQQGGIPTEDRSHDAHIFINLENEYKTIRSYLSSDKFARLGSSEGFSPQGHLRNITLAKDFLSLLPPTSSALITTPKVAASLKSLPAKKTASGGAAYVQMTKNALIHNVMTDKPMISSSLPVDRISSNANTAAGGDRVHVTTNLKKGLALSIFPDPLVQPWTPPNGTATLLSLEDSRLDLARLVELIEDSFGRKLDVEKYFARIKNQIAGIIVAGEYEGGAILTWERPLNQDGTSIPNINRWVPYLDKFAVLKRCQGTGGVADIVFKAMVRDCFPGGVCWRSRQNNPVNNWYADRAEGHHTLPKTNWTVFWTTAYDSFDEHTHSDYCSVCENVKPSWAEDTGVVD